MPSSTLHGNRRQSTAIDGNPMGQATSTATTMTQPTGCRSTGISVGCWVFSPNHPKSVRILDGECVWNHTVCRVGVPLSYPSFVHRLRGSDDE